MIERCSWCKRAIVAGYPEGDVLPDSSENSNGICVPCIESYFPEHVEGFCGLTTAHCLSGVFASPGPAR